MTPLEPAPRRRGGSCPPTTQRSGALCAHLWPCLRDRPPSPGWPAGELEHEEPQVRPRAREPSSPSARVGRGACGTLFWLPASQPRPPSRATELWGVADEMTCLRGSESDYSQRQVLTQVPKESSFLSISCRTPSSVGLSGRPQAWPRRLLEGVPGSAFPAGEPPFLWKALFESRDDSPRFSGLGRDYSETTLSESLTLPTLAASSSLLPKRAAFHSPGHRPGLREEGCVGLPVVRPWSCPASRCPENP